MLENIRKLLKRDISHFQAVLLLISTAVLWSFGGLFIKLIDMHPAATAGGRSAIAALLFFLLLGKPKLKMTRSQWGATLAYTATVIFFVFGTRLTTAANAILLQYTAPAYTILLSAWLLKEKNSKIDYAAVALVFVGMGLFFVEGFELGHMLGNLFAILSGVSFAIMVVFLRKQKQSSTWEPIFWGNILTAIVGLPFMVGGLPDATGWWALVALGVFQLGMSYILYTMAIKKVTAVEATLVPVIEPVLNPLWVFFGIGELPGVWAIVGGLVVILTVSARFVIVYRFSNRLASK